MTFGRPIRRVEDGPLLRGTAQFVADLARPGQVSLVVVRSPVAHGHVVGVDTADARSLDGVLGVWTAADVRADLGWLPRIEPRVSPSDAVVPYLQPVLADGRTRYVGEPIAVVVASDRYVAEDAAGLVDVEIDPLPVSLGLPEAADGESLFPEGNHIATLEARFGDPDTAFETSEFVVEADLAIDRHTGVPMETRGLLVEPEPATGRLVVHGATKVPHANRIQLAKHLGVPIESIRMRETAVGGGFGVRGEYYPEDFLVPWAARRLGCPVSWIEDRREHMIAANHSRQQVHRAAIAGDAGGTILAIRTEFWADLGAYVRTHGLRVPDLTLSMLPGPYDVPAYAGRAHCVVSNRTPTATYRAPGRFESCFVRERLVDLFAAKLGADPVEVRRRNLITPAQMPYRREIASTGERVVLNEGNYAALLDRVEVALDRRGIAARKRAGERVGAGIAMFLEKSGLGPFEWGGVCVTADGGVRVRSGGSSVGQGIRTALAQIVAEVLVVPTSEVVVELLDTDHVPRGTGSFASRTTATAGSAVHQAAHMVAEQALRAAAAELEIDVADLELDGGAVCVRGAKHLRISLGELAARLEAKGEPLDATDEFTVERVTYPYGTHAAVVVVDTDTGAITVERLVLGYDVGRAVNPRLVEGQLFGGAVQALGGALLERFAYDADGNPLATSFMDYLLPTVAEVPQLVAIVTEDTPTSTNPLGVKGAGEGGVTGVAPAIVAAVEDAVGCAGLLTRTPLHPEAVLEAVRAASVDRAGGPA